MNSALLQFMYQALDTRYGVCLSSPEPDKVRNRLYKLRKEGGDPTLYSLAIHSFPDREELWIVKKGPSDAAP